MCGQEKMSVKSYHNISSKVFGQLWAIFVIVCQRYNFSCQTRGAGSNKQDFLFIYLFIF